jgi:hypothetical protein
LQGLKEPNGRERNTRCKYFADKTEAIGFDLARANIHEYSIIGSVIQKEYNIGM